MAPPAPRSPSEIWSRRFIACGLISFPLGIALTYYLRAPIVALISIYSGLALGSCGIIIHLTGVSQMRIIELLATMAILGNAVGIEWQQIQDRMHHISWRERLIVFTAVAFGTIVVVLGGVTNGLWLVKRLGEESLSRRLGVVLVSLLRPLAICAIAGSTIGIVIGLSEVLKGNTGYISHGLLSLLILLSSCSIIMIHHQVGLRAKEIDHSRHYK